MSVTRPFLFLVMGIAENHLAEKTALLKSGMNVGAGSATSHQHSSLKSATPRKQLAKKTVSQEDSYGTSDDF